MRIIISYDGEDLDNELSYAGLTAARHWENQEVMGSKWDNGSILRWESKRLLREVVTSTTRTRTGLKVKCWRE